MQQNLLIPLGYPQIPAMEKFEDRPMSPDFELHPMSFLNSTPLV